MKNLIIFGGQDVEQAAATLVARTSGMVIATATVAGVRCHAGNAYNADGFILEEGDMEGVTSVIIFECSPKVAPEGLEVVLRADHHNPGDAGFGLGPENFFKASSLGQLINFLGVEPTHEQLLVAAGDHCPADAYAGRCPGIDPLEFGAFRIKGKVDFYSGIPKLAHKADEGKILVTIEAAKAVLQSATEVDGVRDLRSIGFVDELPEAALSTGLAYISEIDEVDRQQEKTGNRKIVLGGHTTPETVTNFMAWANTLPNKVGDAYGNPTRGFAGVVVKP